MGAEERQVRGGNLLNSLELGDRLADGDVLGLRILVAISLDELQSIAGRIVRSRTDHIAPALGRRPVPKDRPSLVTKGRPDRRH